MNKAATEALEALEHERALLIGDISRIEAPTAKAALNRALKDIEDRITALQQRAEQENQQIRAYSIDRLMTALANKDEEALRRERDKLPFGLSGLTNL